MHVTLTYFVPAAIKCQKVDIVQKNHVIVDLDCLDSMIALTIAMGDDFPNSFEFDAARFEISCDTSGGDVSCY